MVSIFLDSLLLLGMGIGDSEVVLQGPADLVLVMVLGLKLRSRV